MWQIILNVVYSSMGYVLEIEIGTWLGFFIKVNMYLIKLNKDKKKHS